MTASRSELRARLRALATRGGEASEAGTLARESATPRAELPQPGARTLRVSLETLDRILDLTGEIAVDRGRLREALERGDGDGREAAEMHRESDRLHAELQELVMKARMEPLGATFRRFGRTVRDLADALGKSARLVIEGEDVEVDAKVIEHVRDPRTHLSATPCPTASSRPRCAARAARTLAACCGCVRSAKPAAS